MFCVDCGKYLADVSKFCHACGKPTLLQDNSTSQQDKLNPIEIIKESNLTKPIHNSTDQYLYLGLGIFLLAIVGRIATISGFWTNCGSVAITSINIFQQADLLSGKFEGIACTGLEKSFAEIAFSDFNFIIVQPNTIGSICGFLLVLMISSFYKYFKTIKR
jgi:hypothetical protein